MFDNEDIDVEEDGVTGGSNTPTPNCRRVRSTSFVLDLVLPPLLLQFWRLVRSNSSKGTDWSLVVLVLVLFVLVLLRLRGS